MNTPENPRLSWLLYVLDVPKQKFADNQASSAYLNEVLKGVGKNFDQEMLKRLPVRLSSPLDTSS
jgi:hypothetical protein